MVFGIGEAASMIMEKVYVGDIDPLDLGWINAIVEDTMGSMVKKVTEIVSADQGEFNIKDILKVLVSKK